MLIFLDSVKLFNQSNKVFLFKISCFDFLKGFACLDLLSLVPYYVCNVIFDICFNVIITLLIIFSVHVIPGKPNSYADMVESSHEDGLFLVLSYSKQVFILNLNQ